MENRGLHLRTAFVLFKAEPSMEREAYLTLSNMDAVTETHALYGEYDLVACVKAENAKELTQLLMGNLRTIPGIKETETLIVVDY
jgi:DNA-binding Lrp family transcriptional regulator